MASKSKKAPAKVAPKKVAKAAKPAKEAKKKEPTVSLVSFAVRAVIPTQQYGNIQPEITVVADSFEEARAYVMPLIEDLYKHYGESKPGFLGKVVETEKVVAPAPQTAPATPPQATTPPQAPAQDVPAPEATASSVVKPEPVLKAEKAISLAMTAEAATLIQDQIEKSVKIPAEFKPALIELVLAKRSNFK